MRIILCPHSTPYFGQDFTSIETSDALKCTPVFLKNNRYDLADIDEKKISLIVSRNADRECDLEVIERYHKKVPITIHLHLNYSFLNSDQKNILKRSLAVASLRVTNCESLCNDYSALFPFYDWLFVNNGINSNVFYPSTINERTRIKNRLKIDSNKILVSHVGRLNNAKGVQIFERVLERFSASSNYHFVVQTHALPKYQDVILELCKKYKHASIITDQTFKTIRYCDVHISTSLAETTSLTTLESLFSGVPTICTDVTSFYYEVNKNYSEEKYFTLIPIDHIRKEIKCEKSKIFIKESHAANIANDFAYWIKDYSPLTQQQRENLANKFHKSKFEKTVMIKQLEVLYNKVELTT